MDKKFSIQWYDSKGMGFWLRGVKHDGSYYGELEYAYGDPSRAAGTAIVGEIADADWARLQPLLARFTTPVPTKREHWVGQLASWTDNFVTPEILFQYELGDELTSDIARTFLEIRAIVAECLSEQAAGLIEFSKKTHRQRPNPTAAPHGRGATSG